MDSSTETNIYCISSIAHLNWEALIAVNDAAKDEQVASHLCVCVQNSKQILADKEAKFEAKLELLTCIQQCAKLKTQKSMKLIWRQS